MISIDIRERKYVSQFSQDTFGLAVFVAGVPADADGTVTCTMTREDTNSGVFTRAATNVGTGLYEITLSSAEASIPGFQTLAWTYQVGGIDQTTESYLLIGTTSPAYDALVPDMKALVDNVWVRFADCFDSPAGGPNLLTYYQTNFGHGRIAQLLRIAVGYMNTMAQPFMSYTIDGDGGATFPMDMWGSLLEEATYVECLKHLIRSYVEQPNLVGPQVSRLDRRDYMDRWRQILSDEQPILRAQFENFKIRNMGFGRPKVLVSGGVFGRFGPTRIAGSMAARPRYYSRWY